MRRRIHTLVTPAAIAVCAALALSGCSSAGEDSQNADSAVNGCQNLLSPGSLSDSVSLSEGGVNILGPSDIVNAQRSVVEHGEAGGHIAQPGDVVTANITTYDAVRSDVLDERMNAPHLALPESALADTRAALNGPDSNALNFNYLIATALVCTSPGDTVVLALTPMQSVASQLSVNAAVAVIEVLDTFPAQAQGAVRGLPNGFPAIATDETGRPGVVLPPHDPPSSKQVAPRIEGTGEEVSETDRVIGHVLTVDWTGTVISNSWVDGLVDLGTSEVPNPAFNVRGDLTGFPVGSQVVILDPADGNPVVQVVDIIATA